MAVDPNFEIDSAAYNALLNRLNEVHSIDRQGDTSDFKIFSDDQWLTDAAVIDFLNYTKGEWAVELVFVCSENFQKFIVRRITSYTCPKKAALASSLMRRIAAKDQRGTIFVNTDGLLISNN